MKNDFEGVEEYYQAEKNTRRSEQTKDAVLLEATRCIFAPANTGYLGSGEDDSQGNRIIEIFKMVGSGPGGK